MSLRGALGWRGHCQVRQIHHGLHVLQLRPLGRFPAGLAGWIRRRTIKLAAEALGFWAPVAICTRQDQLPAAKAARPLALVYLAPLEAAAAGPLETKGLREFDAIITGSPRDLGGLSQVHEHAFLLEEGIDPADFASPALDAAEASGAIRNLLRPRVGFLGRIDTRLDQELVATLARQLPEAAIVLAGPVQEGLDMSPLRVLKNVHVQDIHEEHETASFLKELDVAVFPLTQPPERLSDVLALLAADVPVVSTPLGQDHPVAEAVSIASGHEAFTAAVVGELENPDRLAPARRKVVEASSWQRRTDQLEDVLRAAIQIAADRREQQGIGGPRLDRHGRQVVQVEPQLDGKDASVRLLHDNYVQYRLSAQQHLIYIASRLVGLAYWSLRVPLRLMRREGLVRRILVVRNGHLGDTVVFLPTLAALRKRYPAATISVALAPDSGARQLLEASPLVDEVLPLDFFNRSRLDRFRGAMKLLARGFDLTVGGVWYFHLPEAVFNGAPQRLGLYDGHPLQRYADRVVMLDPTLHEAENNLRLVELVIGAVDLKDRVPSLVLDEALLRERGRDLRQRLGLAADATVVAMHPGSKRPSRRWPPEAFAQLAEALLLERPQLEVVFTGAGADEQELIARIRGMIRSELHRRTHDGSRYADLLGVIGFYDTCKLLVCNDTGVMHVARARGVPLVAIIGPENDRRWGPHPLGTAPAVAVRNQVPGTPHGKWDCEWNLSLLSIDPSRIKRHCDDMLDGTFLDRHGILPIAAGSGRLFPLVRDLRRLSFAQLQEMGLPVPRVAMLLAQDPALLGGHGRAATAQCLADAARSVRAQHYPATETILVVADAEMMRGLAIGPAKVIEVAPDNPDAAWASVLGQTAARLLWPASPHASLDPAAVASRVAVFLRGPKALVVDDQRGWPVRTLVESQFVGGPWMVERSALEVRLIHPLPAVPLDERVAPPRSRRRVLAAIEH